MGEHITLVFTKVLDEMQHGLVDEDEDAISAPTDRSYWEKEKGTPKTVSLMDRLFELVKEDDPEVELKYNKFYVGLTKDGRADNYAQFRPQKTSVVFEIRLPRTDETDAKLEEAGIETLEYSMKGAEEVCAGQGIELDGLQGNEDVLLMLAVEHPQIIDRVSAQTSLIRHTGGRNWAGFQFEDVGRSMTKWHATRSCKTPSKS